MTQEEINVKLFDLLGKSVTPFHTVSAAQEQLEEAGFQELLMKNSWVIEPRGKYFMKHHDSSLIAFSVGNNAGYGGSFRIAAAHTDFPCLHLKPNPEVTCESYAQVNVEVYGGAILNTWLDRPLSLAGKVALRSEEIFKPEMRLIDVKDKIFTIPNLAIHMNREVNDGVALNKQTDMLPLVGMIKDELEKKNFMMTYLAKKLDVKMEDILDYELFLYCAEEPTYIGINQEFISAARLDDVNSVQALLSGIIEGNNDEGYNLIALFNHEEIGSSTKQGAGSALLNSVIEKILIANGRTPEQVIESMYDSILLSVDVAHALHPNKPAKMDITNKPVLNGGIIIKEACAQTYATDCEAVAIIQQLCESEQIPYQKFVNRSDERGGGTLGAIASALLPVKTIDVGVPLLAMHSAKELMGAKDELALYQLVKAFFSK
jgi:aspartyl aminopeptidase